MKLLLNRSRILKEKLPTVKKKSLRLVLNYIGTISLPTRTKLQNSSEGYLNAVNYSLFLEIKKEFCNNVCCKHPITQILTAGLVYKFQCGLYNESYYVECLRHLSLISGEHIGISPLTNKRVKPRKNSAFCHNLLHCNYYPTFEDTSALYQDDKLILDFNY